MSPSAKMGGLSGLNSKSMGYYTSYCISFFGDPKDANRFGHALLDHTKRSDGSDDFEVKELLNTGNTYAKLYDIEQHITEVAKNFPNLLIILDGDGEDSMDSWQARWKGEIHETKNVVIPPFDNADLMTEYEKKNIKK